MSIWTDQARRSEKRAEMLRVGAIKSKNAGRGERPPLKRRPSSLLPAETIFRIGEVKFGKGCLCIRFKNAFEIQTESPQTEAFMLGCWQRQQLPSEDPEDREFVRFDDFGFTFWPGDVVVATNDGMKLVFKALIEVGTRPTTEPGEVQFYA